MRNNRNLLGAVSYITWIGFIVAFAMGDRTDRFMMHHLNQALVINIASIVGGVFAVIPVLGSAVAGLVSMAVVVFDIMGAISAYRGSMAALPLVGDIHLIG